MATRKPNDSGPSDKAAAGNFQLEGTAARDDPRPNGASARTSPRGPAAREKSTGAARRGTRASNDANSVRPTRRRAPARSTASAVQGPQIDSSTSRQVSTSGDASPAARGARATPVRPKASNDAVPENVRRRFLQVGRDYYFPDGARAFTDRGQRLTTPSENTEVIRSLVTIAQARGWQDITVTGTERFRKEAWFAAKLAGLEVRGYRASEIEQTHLVRLMAREGRDHGNAPGDSDGRSGPEASTGSADRPRSAGRGSRDAAGERRGGLIVGRLVDHGGAVYRHQAGEPMSYFVKLETDNGERTIWGVDLERAFRKSLTKPQPGEEVGLRAVRQDLVTVKARERDAEVRVLGERNLATHRNRWIVEKRTFFDERRAAARAVRDPTIEPKRAVQEHPALIGTYLNLHAAELAAKRFRDPEDRERFVGIVRNALADTVARGEPLPPVRVREPATAPRSSRPERPATRSSRVAERDRAPVRG